MVNMLEICLSHLINKKILLENELERLVNSDQVDSETKFNTSLELVEKISAIYQSIELTNSYITKNKNNQNGEI